MFFFRPFFVYSFVAVEFYLQCFISLLFLFDASAFNIEMNWMVLRTRHLCSKWKFQFIFWNESGKEERVDGGMQLNWNDGANQCLFDWTKYWRNYCSKPNVMMRWRALADRYLIKKNQIFVFVFIWCWNIKLIESYLGKIKCGRWGWSYGSKIWWTIEKYDICSSKTCYERSNGGCREKISFVYWFLMISQIDSRHLRIFSTDTCLTVLKMKFFFKSHKMVTFCYNKGSHFSRSEQLRQLRWFFQIVGINV